MIFGGAKDGEGTVTVMLGKDSKVEATMELKIAPAEFDRIADANVTCTSTYKMTIE